MKLYAAKLAAVVGMIFFSGITQAGLIYTFTGKNFDVVSGNITTSDNLEITIKLDQQLPSNATSVDITTLAGFTFAASAGPEHSVIDNNGNLVPGEFSVAEFSTDLQGDIIAWELFWTSRQPIPPSQDNGFSDAFELVTHLSSVGTETGFGFDKYMEGTYSSVTPLENVNQGDVSSDTGVWRVTNINAPVMFLLFALSCAALIRCRAKKSG